MIRSSMTAKVAGRMSGRSPLKDSSPMTDTSPPVWRYQPDWPVDVLGILMSEFDEGLKEPRLGIKLKSCGSGVFFIITSAEICR